MSCGIMRLVAYGVQDIYLTSNLPHITYFGVPQPNYNCKKCYIRWDYIIVENCWRCKYSEVMKCLVKTSILKECMSKTRKMRIGKMREIIDESIGKRLPTNGCIYNRLIEYAIE